MCAGIRSVQKCIYIYICKYIVYLYVALFSCKYAAYLHVAPCIFKHICHDTRAMLTTVNHIPFVSFFLSGEHVIRHIRATETQAPRGAKS